ncbi:hypothetical protein P8452_00286 [Trifolium repens]|nr:hypothetical protein P8452_00286 [Trifolium repens]
MTTKKKKKKLRVDWITLFIMVCVFIGYSLIFTCMFHIDMASSKFVAGDEAHKSWMTIFKQWLNISSFSKAKTPQNWFSSKSASNSSDCSKSESFFILASIQPLLHV